MYHNRVKELDPYIIDLVINCIKIIEKVQSYITVLQVLSISKQLVYYYLYCILYSVYIRYSIRLGLEIKVISHCRLSSYHCHEYIIKYCHYYYCCYYYYACYLPISTKFLQLCYLLQQRTAVHILEQPRYLKCMYKTLIKVYLYFY